MLPFQPTVDLQTSDAPDSLPGSPYNPRRFSLLKLFGITTAIAVLAAGLGRFATGDPFGPVMAFWAYLHIWCIAAIVRHFYVICFENKAINSR